MPVKKWSLFTVYEKDNFDEQVLEVVYSHNAKLQLSPDNFLHRLPKFFFWKLCGPKESASRESNRFSTITNRNTKQDAVTLLQHMVDENIVRPGYQ